MFGRVRYFQRRAPLEGEHVSTWIESHQDLRSNPKTRRAARALETTVPALMGHLHCLWHWALDHAEDGDVSPFDADDLADAAGWEGEAQTFVDALTDCGPGEKAGFLEPDGLIGDPDDGKRSPLALHDWWEYAGKLIAKRRKDAERKARARAKDIPPPSEAPPEDSPEDVPGTSGGQDAERPRDGAGTEPNRTEPNRTQHTEPKGGARKRATQLPDGWVPQPEDALQAEAVAAGVDLRRELDRFRDHWPAQPGAKGRKADWQATWRNWLRGSIDRAPARARDGPSKAAQVAATYGAAADEAERRGQ